MNTMKWLGVLDGVAMAALTALAKLAPETAVWAGPAVMFLGTLGTILGARAAVQS